MDRLTILDCLRGKKIVVLGAGQLGELLLNLWPREISQPALFLDEKRVGYLNGIGIERTKKHHFSNSNIYILAFFKDDPIKVNKLFREVIKQEIITAYDVLTIFQPDLFSNGWTGDSANVSQVLDNLQFFSDEKSKEVLKSVVNWRYLRLLDDTTTLSLENSKYDLTKYGILSRDYNFICDGGSYDMSFILKQLKSGVNAETIVAVEPDVKRFNVIENILRESKYSFQRKTNVMLDNRALWSSTGIAKFYGNGLFSARIARFPDKSCLDVNTVTLFDLIRELRISPRCKSLVKLHIESAEWPVIKSSLEGLMSFDRLDLLINLSHDEDSLFNIPRVLGLSKKYDLFLDSFALFGEGLTLFAKTRSQR